jgi:hypothetical protein
MNNCHIGPLTTVVPFLTAPRSFWNSSGGYQAVLSLFGHQKRHRGTHLGGLTSPCMGPTWGMGRTSPCPIFGAMDAGLNWEEQACAILTIPYDVFHSTSKMNSVPSIGDPRGTPQSPDGDTRCYVGAICIFSLRVI